MQERSCGREILCGLSILLMSFLCFAQGPGGPASIRGAATQVTGEWRGNSECVEKDSPCHDEINVYRFSDDAGKAGWFLGTGNKVVDGKEIAMGTMEWKYDAEKHTLEASNSGTKIQLVLDGNKMEGSLTLRDNRPYRRIHLAKTR